MAIFNTTRATNEEKFDLPVYEGYGPENCAFMEAFIEDSDAELAVIEAMHACDMIEIEGLRKITAMTESATGEETDYEPEEDEDEGELSEEPAKVTEAKAELQAALEEAGEKVKKSMRERLSELWAKIKAFFTNIGRHIKSIFVSNKDFTTKYAKALAKIEGNIEFKVDGYDYDHGLLTTNFGTLVAGSNTKTMELVNAYKGKIFGTADEDKLGRLREDFEKKSEGLLDIVRGKCAGIDGAVSEEEFANALFDAFRGKDAHKDKAKEITIDSAGIKKCRDFLDGYNNQINVLAKAEKESDNMFKPIIAELKDDNKTALGGQVAIMNKLISIVSGHHRIVTTAIHAWTKAVSEYNSYCRKVLLKAMQVASKDAQKEA